MTVLWAPIWPGLAFAEAAKEVGILVEEKLMMH
jgi:hypothetical protein